MNECFERAIKKFGKQKKMPEFLVKYCNRCKADRKLKREGGIIFYRCTRCNNLYAIR